MDKVVIPWSDETLIDWTLAYCKVRGKEWVPPVWMEQIYQDNSKDLVIMKAAQVFVSEYLIHLGLYVADRGLGGRGNVLFVQPTQGMMDDFSQDRINKVIEDSEYLSRRTDKARLGKRMRAPSRVRLKKVGKGIVYMRGSDKRRQLISVPSDCLLLDEIEEYGQVGDEGVDAMGVIAMAEQRLGSSTLGIVRKVSTPKFEGGPIHKLYLGGTQNEWWVRCASCGEEQPISGENGQYWESNIDRERRMVVCRECGGKLSPMVDDGEWIPRNPSGRYPSYHISRLMSPYIDVGRALAMSESGDPSTVKEFYNSVLGLPYTPSTGKIAQDLLDRFGDHYVGARGGESVMGVDVGRDIYIVVRQISPVVDLYMTKVRDFEELDLIMEEYNVTLAVVDRYPETREAIKFQDRFQGRVWLSEYVESAGSAVWDEKKQVVKVNRTVAMDAMYARFREGGILIPKGRPQEWLAHMMAPARVMDKDARGRTVMRYVEGGLPDHYAHAETYAELATSRVGYGSGMVTLSLSGVPVSHGFAAGLWSREF